jgi:hypothetical protein
MEVYSLRYREGEGLQLETVDSKFGEIDAANVREFVNITEIEGGHVWQCNPLTVTASKNGEFLWASDIPMQGQPESLSVLNNVLFIKTTGGHSFYVMKDTGELLLYADSVMLGKNALEDLLRLWRIGFRDPVHRRLYRFIRAAVILNEKRSIPLLIKSIEAGQGVDVKCAAIAALEKFNGNPEYWPVHLPPPPKWPPQDTFLKRVGWNRAVAAKGERPRWERIFKDQLDE